MSDWRLQYKELEGKPKPKKRGTREFMVQFYDRSAKRPSTTTRFLTEKQMLNFVKKNARGNYISVNNLKRMI